MPGNGIKTTLIREEPDLGYPSGSADFPEEEPITPVKATITTKPKKKPKVNKKEKYFNDLEGLINSFSRDHSSGNITGSIKELRRLVEEGRKLFL